MTGAQDDLDDDYMDDDHTGADRVDVVAERIEELRLGLLYLSTVRLMAFADPEAPSRPC